MSNNTELLLPFANSHPWLLTFDSLVFYVLNVSVIVGTVWRMLLSIWLFAQFRHPTSPFSSSFYKVFAFQGIPNWFIMALAVAQYCGLRHPTFLFIDQVLKHVWITSVTLCDSVLMLNRFTALILWRWHRSIWSDRTTTAVVVFMFIFPFLITCFLLDDFYCMFTPTPACASYFTARQQATLIANVCNSIFPLLLGIVVFGFQTSRLRKYNTLNYNRRTELQLFLICVISDVLLFVNVVTKYVQDLNKASWFTSYGGAVTFELLFAVSSVSWILFMFCFIVLLPVMNAGVRNGLSSFYCLDRALRFCSNPVNSVSQITTTASPSGDRRSTHLVRSHLRSN